MSETFRNPEELERVVDRLGLEVESGPYAEIGRVAAEIDRDVPDVAGEDADKLALGLAELVVQAPENPFAGEGVVVLNNSAGKLCSAKVWRLKISANHPRLSPKRRGSIYFTLWRAVSMISMATI